MPAAEVFQNPGNFNQSKLESSPAESIIASNQQPQLRLTPTLLKRCKVLAFLQWYQSVPGRSVCEGNVCDIFVVTHGTGVPLLERRRGCS